MLQDPDNAARIVEQAEGYSLSSSDGHDLIVSAPEDQAALAHLNRLLVESGVDIVAFAAEKMSLEDLFVQISSGEAGDV